MNLKKKISKNNLNVEKRSKKIDEWFIPRDRSAFYDTHDFHPYFAAYPPNLVSRILDKYGKEKVTLDSILANNVAGKPLKVDKYDENSQSYVYSSYYIIGILTMSFFIYKQLKQ